MTHGHHHAPRPGDHTRAFAIGIGLNMAFVAVEAYYGWRSGSLALLADAGHNLSDVAGLLLAWIAAIAGSRAPDQRHTYGWRRASILAALVNAIVLLLAMGSLAWEAIGRLSVPTPTQANTLMAVAGLGVVVNAATAALFLAGGKTDLNLRGAFLHMAADALVSLGVVAAGALYLLTGWDRLDPVVSLVIALVIVLGTWRLLTQSLHLLFDGVPESVDLKAVHGYLSSRPGVDDVHDLHVWATGTSDIALTAHLVMPAGHPGDAFFEEIAAQLHERYEIVHPTIQVDIGRSDHGCAAPAGLVPRRDTRTSP